MQVSSGTAHADPVFWNTCGQNMRWPGNAGYVAADLQPSRFVVWTVRDYLDDYGIWVADVFVGRTRVDHKEQTYNPHGRVNPVDLKSGYILHFVIQHIDTKGNKSFSDPAAGCIIP